MGVLQKETNFSSSKNGQHLFRYNHSKIWIPHKNESFELTFYTFQNRFLCETLIIFSRF